MKFHCAIYLQINLVVLFSYIYLFIYIYIYGFDRRHDLSFCIERVWKGKKDQLIRNSIDDTTSYAPYEKGVVNNIDEEKIGVK